jgi:hypothetical protein
MDSQHLDDLAAAFQAINISRYRPKGIRWDYSFVDNEVKSRIVKENQKLRCADRRRSLATFTR